MAKKIGLNLGKREIKKAEVIEETHANISKSTTTTTTTTKVIHRKQRAKKDWKVASVRLEKSEFEKIEEYMRENEISFNALVRDFFIEKGII